MTRKRLFLPTFSLFIFAFVTVALSFRADKALAQTATEPNFKVAFIGDSGHGGGPVIIFFVDYPENKVPLGPVK